MDQFLLGLPKLSMLAQATAPAFLTRTALLLPDGRQRLTLPRSPVDWGLDSGGFTELSNENNRQRCYRLRPAEYAAEVCRYAREIGRLKVAFVQDWMCEACVLRRTRRSIEEHQLLTIASLMELRSIAPGLPWAPVLQGDSAEDYERHVALYLANGIDLRCEPLVGVGSICRRQGTLVGVEIVRRLARYDLRLHLFGYKRLGLVDALPYAVSADSMAWSTHARKNRILLPGCDHRRERDSAKGYGPKGEITDCRNCLKYAEHWLRELHELLRADPDADRIAAFWGLAPPSPAELRAWQNDTAGEDPWERLTSQIERGRDPLGDAMVSAGFAAGLSLPPTPMCHFLGNPDAPCVAATYQPPRAPRLPLPGPPPRPNLKTLPATPGPGGTFVPWAPQGQVPAGSVPVLLTLTRARRYGLAAGGEVMGDLSAYSERGPLDEEDGSAPAYYPSPDLLYDHYTERLPERLARLPEHASFLGHLAAAPAEQRAALREAYDGGVRDAVYRGCVALSPEGSWYRDRPGVPNRRLFEVPAAPPPSVVRFFGTDAERRALALLLGRRETGDARRRWLARALLDDRPFQQLAGMDHRPAVQQAIEDGVERACARPPFKALPPGADAEWVAEVARRVEVVAGRFLVEEGVPEDRKARAAWLAAQLVEDPETQAVAEGFRGEPSAVRRPLEAAWRDAVQWSLGAAPPAAPAPRARRSKPAAKPARRR